MENIYDSIMNNSEACRESGKKLFFDAERPQEERDIGLKLLRRAAQLRDPEARYILGFLLIENRLKLKQSDSVEWGLSLVCEAASDGFLPARIYLNCYCENHYERNITFDKRTIAKGPLMDFDGKRIKLKKSGLMTPIDTHLEYVNGINILTLSANIVFFDGECDMKDPDIFYNAVYDGFQEWAGDYEVFGGQKLRVEVKLTAEDRIFDNIFVIPMTRELNDQVINVWNKLGTKKTKSRVNSVIGSKRSLAGIGIRKWSVSSRKFIMMQSENGRFDDYEEMKHVAKHEFGHVLGLGDLYKSTVDGLSGVDKGSYREMDSYYIRDNVYNLVMCDHHGPISNNDIEMVVLAFSKNRLQNYQLRRVKDKISEALGKGN